MDQRCPSCVEDRAQTPARVPQGAALWTNTERLNTIWAHEVVTEDHCRRALVACPRSGCARGEPPCARRRGPARPRAAAGQHPRARDRRGGDRSRHPRHVAHRPVAPRRQRMARNARPSGASRHQHPRHDALRSRLRHRLRSTRHRWGDAGPAAGQARGRGAGARGKPRRAAVVCRRGRPDPPAR